MRGKNREVVAAGGNFDCIVSRFAAPKATRPTPAPHVVGFSLAVARLSQVAQESNATAGKALLARREEHLRSYGGWAIRRADVYVVSFVRELVDSRLQVVRDLWKAGIRADLAYDSSVSTLTPEQLSSACRREGILYLVIVKYRADDGDKVEKTVKVKSVLRGYEEELLRSDLVPWLTDKLREQAVVDEQVLAGTGGQAGEPGGETYGAFLPRGDAERGARAARQEFVPILMDDAVRQKGRLNKKGTMVKNAERNVSAAAAAAAEAPVCECCRGCREVWIELTCCDYLPQSRSTSTAPRSQP